MVATSTRERWSDTFQHEAFFYAGADEFLAGAVSFVHQGLEDDEPILVAVPRPRMRALKAELNGGAGRVTFLDMEVIGSNPAHIIPAWKDFLSANGDGARPVRGIGEPIWAGRSAAETIECQRHEALLNVAFAMSGSWRLLCPYDVAGLPEDVIAEAERTHPWLSHADGHRHASHRCRHLDAMAAPFDAPLPPPPVGATTVPFTFDDIPAVRQLVASVGARAGFDPSRTDDLVLATHELLINTIRHAGGKGTVRIWRHANGVVCEVADDGRIDKPLAGRERPHDDDPGGRGMWMANQLCDLVQIRTFATGNLVRLHMRLAPPS